MSKLKKLKETLAKLLQEFGNVTTDKGVISWDGDEDLKAGDSVYVEDSEGNRTPAADGDYKTDDNKVIVVVDGKVSEIKDAEAEVDSEFIQTDKGKLEWEFHVVNDEIWDAEAEVDSEFIQTDKGKLEWDDESRDLQAGDAVYTEDEEGNRVPAPDGDYTTEDGKVIRVVDGKVSEIVDDKAEVAPEMEEEIPVEEPDPRDERIRELEARVRELEAENAALKEQVAKMRKMSAAKPAHNEVKESAKFAKTGNKGLDNLQRILSAK